MVETVEEFITLVKRKGYEQDALSEAKNATVVDMLAKNMTSQQFQEIAEASLYVGMVLQAELWRRDPKVRGSTYRTSLSPAFIDAIAKIITPDQFAQLAAVNFRLAAELLDYPGLKNTILQSMPIETWTACARNYSPNDEDSLDSRTLDLLTSLSTEFTDELNIEEVKKTIFYKLALITTNPIEQDFQRIIAKGYIALNHAKVDPRVSVRETLKKYIDKIIELSQWHPGLIISYLQTKEIFELIVLNSSIEQFFQLINWGWNNKSAPSLPMTQEIVAFLIRHALTADQFVKIVSTNIAVARNLVRQPLFLDFLVPKLLGEQFAIIAAEDIITASYILNHRHVSDEIKNRHSYEEVFGLAIDQFIRSHPSFLRPPLAEAIAKRLSFEQFMRLANHHLPSAIFLLNNPALKDNVLEDKFLKNMTLTQFISLIKESAEKNNPPLLKSSFVTLIDDMDDDLKHELKIDEIKEELFASVARTDPERIAIQRAIAQIYLLLSNPSACAPYLKFLNNETERYYREKNHESFPWVSSHYHFEKIYNKSIAKHAIDIPIPDANYQKIKKAHSFPEYLMLFLQQHGFKENAYRWIGFIPEDKADAMLIKGQFVTEGLVTDAELIHGKHIHMLQLALVFCAIDDGKVDLDYIDDEAGSHQKLSFPDILTYILKNNVNLPPFRGAFSLWGYIFDRGYNAPGGFCSPGQLNSFLMQPDQVKEYPAMANYLIDSFCTRFNKMLKIFNYNREQYIERIQGKDTSLFEDISGIPISKVVAADEILTNAKSGNQYAIIEEKYHPNKKFSPRLFSSKTTQTAPTESASSIHANEKKKT